MKRRISNKKGGAPVDEFIGFVVFVIIAVFTIFIVSLIKSSDEKDVTSQITQQKIVSDAHSSLMSFLIQKNNGKTIAESIQNSYYSKDFSVLESPIKRFFNAKYRGDWALVIENSEGKIILSTNQYNFRLNSLFNVITSEEVAAVYLPINPSFDTEYLKIRLFVIKIKDKPTRESPVGA